ncbi:hypothetical protein GCM10023170_064200 [Phytohabitans houttuyneae]
MAGEVALAGSFDLDDLGAEEHQVIAAVRPGQHVRQIQDPYAAQRSVVHASPLGFGTGYCQVASPPVRYT